MPATPFTSPNITIAPSQPTDINCHLMSHVGGTISFSSLTIALVIRVTVFRALMRGATTRVQYVDNGNLGLSYTIVRHLQYWSLCVNQALTVIVLGSQVLKTQLMNQLDRQNRAQVGIHRPPTQPYSVYIQPCNYHASRPLNYCLLPIFALGRHRSDYCAIRAASLRASIDPALQKPVGYIKP